LEKIKKQKRKVTVKVILRLKKQQEGVKMVGTNFIESVLVAFKNIIGEIEKGSSELEIRRTFDELFLRGVLGYERKDIKWEKKRADLTIIDENSFAIIKIETKKPSEDVDKKIMKNRPLNIKKRQRDI